MSATAMGGFLQRLKRGMAAETLGSLADQELLERFLASRDEGAYVALLRRHGPMILRICRRVLTREPDAEDAFQATFLVLARQAGTIRKHASLASWLHSVAYHIALEMRNNTARRR